MTVYCLIPVHNRLDETRGVLDCLRGQQFSDLRIIVVDDGSSDGTAEYLRDSAPEVELISGDGSLWWGGAMTKGLAAILPRAIAGDYVLFLNNDTRFKPDYVSTLVAVSEAYGRAAVGSPLKDAGDPERFLSIDVRIDYLRISVDGYWPHLERRYQHVRPALKPEDPSRGQQLDQLGDVVESDLLSGRGTLYPVEALRKVGSPRYRWLPHYWSDYEISARVKGAGIPLLIATRAVVWSGKEASGLSRKTDGRLKTLFSRRSRTNIIDLVLFFSLCGPLYLRATAVPRILLFLALGGLNGLRTKLKQSLAPADARAGHGRPH
jgi:GT2 family glycosyltransferase